MAASSMHETYRSGLGALSSFSNMLNELFDSFDEQLHEAKDGIANNTNEIIASKDALSLHELRLRKLEAETDELRKIVETAMKQVVGMEKSIDSQLSDATRELHKEIIIQRTATKMDMSNLRGRVQSSMSEAMGLLSESASRPPLHADNSLNEFDFLSASTGDGMQHLLKRITRIEENIGLQHSINHIIGKSMGSADMVQAVYDSLFDQVTTLTTELATTKQENTHLKRVFADLKAHQDWQDKQLFDIMTAFNDKAAMQNLKQEISRGDRLPPAPVNLEPPAGIEKSPEELQLEREIAAAHNAGLKKGKRKKTAPFKLQPQLSIREDLGEDDGSVTKEPNNDENGESNGNDEYEEDGEVEETEDNDDADKQEGTNDEAADGEDDDMFGKDMPSAFHSGPLAGGSFLKVSAFETASISKYEQALNKLTTQQSEGQFQLTELQRDVNNRVSELETGMATFRRIAFIIDDLKAGFETVKQRVEVVTGGESVDDKLKQSTFTKIAALKAIWTRIFNELTFALGNLGDSIPDIDNTTQANNTNSRSNNTNESAFHSLINATLSDSEKREQDSKLFFRKAKELAKSLESALEEDMVFEPYAGDNLPATLDRLLPTLERIYDQSSTMLAMDEAARKSNSLDYCFDDLLCADLTPSLRLYVADACKACLPVLDEGIHKVLLLREVKRVLKEVDRKADRVALVETESSTRQLLQSKVDLAEFKAVCSRFASSAELQRLQAQVMEGRAIGIGPTSYAGKEPQAAVGMIGNLQEQPAFIEMTSRFDSLVSVLQDVQGSVRRMVPKEEVAEALRALIVEIKTMRRTFVPHPLFKEAMRTKADAREVDRLLKVITETLGDFNLSSADLSGQAAAFHAKCLLCDKPVTSQRARTVRAFGVGPTQSLSTPQLPSLDQHNAVASAASQLLPALVSSSVSNGDHSPQAAKMNKLRVASEVAVVRTSIDPLPELTDSLVESPRSGAYVQPDPQQRVQGIYKQRIRSSAGGGGGFGPGNKQQQDGR